ncbi:MAG: hypothetical protein AAGL98_03645 [Planctomycetota bacterium]
MPAAIESFDYAMSQAEHRTLISKTIKTDAAQSDSSNIASIKSAIDLIAAGTTVIRAADASGNALATASSIVDVAEITNAVESGLDNYDAVATTNLSDVITSITSLNDLSTADIDARLAAATNLSSNVEQVGGQAVTVGAAYAGSIEVGASDVIVAALADYKAAKTSVGNRPLAVSADGFVIATNDNLERLASADALQAVADGVEPGGSDAVVRAVLAGKRTLTNNGDGTKTLRCFDTDGVTPKIDLAFDVHGQIITSTEDPA